MKRKALLGPDSFPTITTIQQASNADARASGLGTRTDTTMTSVVNEMEANKVCQA